MRRLLFSIFVMGFFLGMLTGCRNFICHTNGVCDCDMDDDPCAHRAPWVRTAPPVGVMPAGYVAGTAPGTVIVQKNAAPQGVTVPVTEVPVARMPTRSGGVSGAPVSRPLPSDR